VALKHIDPSELSPGEFVQDIRRAVEEDGVRLVVIDSLNGYLHAMPEEHFLITQLHELLTYLNQQGATTIMIVAQNGLLGQNMAAPVDASYLADAVVLVRFFEVHGEVRQALSIIKKRGGAHERTIREMRLTSKGIAIGEPLKEFRGVLTGVPSIESLFPPV